MTRTDRDALLDAALTHVPFEGMNERALMAGARDLGMSRDLARGTDYAPFLRLPQGDLTVEAEGNRLCVAGLTHGQEVQMTLRAGLPG